MAAQRLKGSQVQLTLLDADGGAHVLPAERAIYAASAQDEGADLTGVGAQAEFHVGPGGQYESFEEFVRAINGELYQQPLPAEWDKKTRRFVTAPAAPMVDAAAPGWLHYAALADQLGVHRKMLYAFAHAGLLESFLVGPHCARFYRVVCWRLLRAAAALVKLGDRRWRGKLEELRGLLGE